MLSFQKFGSREKRKTPPAAIKSDVGARNTNKVLWRGTTLIQLIAQPSRPQSRPDRSRGHPSRTTEVSSARFREELSKRRPSGLHQPPALLNGRSLSIISHHHLWVRCCELDIYSSRVGGVCQGGLKKMSRTEAKRGKKSNFFDKISKKP